jgi:hypothetical protein
MYTQDKRQKGTYKPYKAYSLIYMRLFVLKNIEQSPTGRVLINHTSPMRGNLGRFLDAMAWRILGFRVRDVHCSRRIIESGSLLKYSTPAKVYSTSTPGLREPCGEWGIKCGEIFGFTS